MDSAQIIQIISIAGFSLAGILLVAAVLMFIKLNIPAIIGDLTGKTAQKQIKAIREQNAETGDKRYRPGSVNVERGTLTESVAQAEDTVKKDKDKDKAKAGDTAKVSQMEVKEYEAETRKTDILVIENTEEVSSGTGLLTDGTEVLEQSSNETTVLSSNEEVKEQENPTKEKGGNTLFELIEDIVMVHTDEVIS